MPTLYDNLTLAGIETAHHASDLYAPNVGTVRTIADKSGVRGIPFTDAVTGESWLEFPFQFSPFWRN